MTSIFNMPTNAHAPSRLKTVLLKPTLYAFSSSKPPLYAYSSLRPLRLLVVEDAALRLLLVEDAVERERDLRAEAGGEAQGVLGAQGAAAAEPQRPEVVVLLAPVGHGRHDAGAQGLDGDGVLEAHAHGVAGVALGVDDGEVLQVVAEGLAQRVDLVRGARRLGGGVRAGLVAEVDAVARDLRAANVVALLDVRKEAVELERDVVPVQRGAVVGRVAVARAEQAALDEVREGPAELGAQRGAGHPALARALLRLDDHADGAGAEQHARAARVEGQRGVLDGGLGTGRAERAEAVAEPGHKRVRARVVAGDDDDAVRAAGAEHVIGHGDGLRRARAGRVRLRVWAARAHDLRELRVSEHEHAEEELAIEDVGLVAALGLAIDGVL
mmetsp:Transcript_39021/g.122194  ORF Transcript_39021/g.122194 Transcript_39021/m.122194 type:complete len:384 (+) Transcript_39021:134-1285(+)